MHGTEPIACRRQSVIVFSDVPYGDTRAVGGILLCSERRRIQAVQHVCRCLALLSPLSQTHTERQRNSDSDSNEPLTCSITLWTCRRHAPISTRAVLDYYLCFLLRSASRTSSGGTRPARLFSIYRERLNVSVYLRRDGRAALPTTRSVSDISSSPSTPASGASHYSFTTPNIVTTGRTRVIHIMARISVIMFHPW